VSDNRPVARKTLDAAMKEAELQRNVVAHLKMFGWLYYHTKFSMGSNAGFPDIVATKGQKLLFIELKREGKLPTDRQMEWLNALYYGVSHVTGAVDVHVWTPSDLSNGTVERVLSKEREQ
jgi:hypothetical protein